MKIIAPLVILALASAALYKTQEVFPKTAYDAMLLGAAAEAARKGVAGHTEAALGMLRAKQARAEVGDLRTYTEPGLQMYRAQARDS